MTHFFQLQIICYIFYKVNKIQIIFDINIYLIQNLRVKINILYQKLQRN